MTIRLLSFTLAALLIAALLPGAEPAPTFAKDVAPILYKSCVSCHRPGQIAPMNLVSYNEVRPWSAAIERAVVSRDMPPWRAHPAGSLEFETDPSLPQEEIDTIVAWVRAGSPKGNDEDIPELPEFASDPRWTYGEPDYVFTLPIEFQIPAEGELDVVNFYSKIPFEADRFVEKLELKPSAHGILHHAGAYIVDIPEGAEIVDGLLVMPDGALEATASTAPNTEQSVFSLAGTSKLISYVPGRGMERHKPGTAKRMPAGKYVRWNMHYQPNGRPMTDRTELGVWFNTKPVTHEILNRSSSGLETYIVEGVEIPPRLKDGKWKRGLIPNIPAYAANWKIIQVQPIPEDITLFGMSPHMHLRGKNMVYVITYPDGTNQTILTVPAYSFEWQLYYELTEPLHIPAGSKLTATAHYDNSLYNPYNPGPHLEVYWAEQSWDEMFSPQIRITIDSRNLLDMETDSDQP